MPLHEPLVELRPLEGPDAVDERLVAFPGALGDLAVSQELRLGVELVAGVAVGGFIGWALDRFLGTAPFLMVLFLGLGAAAGILNVVRTAKRMLAEAPPGKGLPRVLDDDDD